ncbi:MAG: prepilin-type N-terminal cleavage/methylation domain-containing protein [Bacilli bacterium]|nr:prepilin-type N-terminal cleavage/methylation domain-containing protein [Bacilli bacterium]
MNKEKGFTLIELLAVIVILAIIALIATPMVLSMIEKARKSAFMDSAYGIIAAAELAVAENMLEEKAIENVYEAPFEGLKFGGTKPEGIVMVDKEGKIAIALHNNKWCAIKEATESEVRIIEYKKENCKIETPIIAEGSSGEEIELGLESAIPGNYFDIRNQKGTVTCVNLSDENKEVTNTSELKEGKNCIKCNMVYENQLVASFTRTLKVKNNIKSPEEIMTEEAVGTEGIIRIDTSGNKRYAGSNPNNYVCFGTDATTCSGKQLWRIIGVVNGNLKLISTEYYSTGIAYDGNPSNYNNSWTRPASLNTTLHNNVYNSTTWINSTTQKGWMLNNRWKLGGIGSNETLLNFETAEKDSDFTTSNYVGMMTITDIAYGSSDSGCTLSTTLTVGSNACFNSNWLKPTINYEWTIIPYSSLTYTVWFVSSSGRVSWTNASYTNYGVRPVVILDSNVKIKSGKGTTSEPYLLSQ